MDKWVLRKADGPGFFIVVPSASPAGSLLARGQYSLAMSYRHMNKSADPESLVYSQDGDDNPETVVMDVPWDAHWEVSKNAYWL